MMVHDGFELFHNDIATDADLHDYPELPGLDELLNCEVVEVTDSVWFDCKDLRYLLEMGLDFASMECYFQSEITSTVDQWEEIAKLLDVRIA